MFGHGVNLLGGYHRTYHNDTDLNKKDLHKMTWYILNNCDQVKPFKAYVLAPYTYEFKIIILLKVLIMNCSVVCRIYQADLEKDGKPDVTGRLQKGFQIWFKEHVSSLSPFYSILVPA